MRSIPLRDEGLRAQYESLTALVGANINLPPLKQLTATYAENGKRVGGIAFEGEFGENVVVLTGPEARLTAPLKVVAHGEEKPSDTCIYVGDLAQASRVRLRGERNMVAIGNRRSGAFCVDITANDGARIVIGDGTTIRGLKLACRTGSVSIGRNCMFGSDVSIYCVDVHSLVVLEAQTARHVRRAHACDIGEKVWVGKGARLLSGAQVGHGSIIGAHAVLAGEIPPTCSAAGNPCRTIRTDVTWSRTRDKIDGTTRKYLNHTLGCTDIIEHPDAQPIESEST